MKTLNTKSLEKKIKQVESLLKSEGYDSPNNIFLDSEETQFVTFDNTNFDRALIIASYYNVKRKEGDLGDPFISLVGRRFAEDMSIECKEYFISIGKRLTIEVNPYDAENN